MEKKFFAGLATCLFMVGIMIGLAQASVITFDYFPGPDNTLGTSDDIAIDIPMFSALHFTDEYAYLDGGVGFVVDSSTTNNPPNYKFVGIGAIKRHINDYVMAAARPDAGPNESSAAPHRYRFVSSLDGTTPATVEYASLFVGVDVNNKADQTVEFFDINGQSLYSITFPDTAGATASYSSSIGIGSIEVTTSFSVYSDDLLFTPSAVPIPSAVWLLGSGLIGIVGIRRKFKK